LGCSLEVDAGSDLDGDHARHQDVGERVFGARWCSRQRVDEDDLGMLWSGLNRALR
jgi:hypothetical protein